MHPDRKIGFALGILLVGIVAALFFRNEPVDSTAVPGVAREGELNRRLRERDVAVFLDESSGKEGVEDPRGPSQDWTRSELVEDLTRRNSLMPSPIAGAPRTPPVTGPEPTDGFRRPLPPFTTDAEPEQAGPASRTADAQHDPTALADSIAELAESSQRPAAASGPDTAASPSETNSSVNGANDYDEYVVEYGDTLSDIAERFLGSPHRYSEIYEANKDRITAPDKLRVGKALRIPRY